MFTVSLDFAKKTSNGVSRRREENEPSVTNTIWVSTHVRPISKVGN